MRTRASVCVPARSARRSRCKRRAVPVAPCPFDVEAGGFEAREDLVGAAEPKRLGTGEVCSVGQHRVPNDGRVGLGDPTPRDLDPRGELAAVGMGGVAVVRSRVQRRAQSIVGLRVSNVSRPPSVSIR